MNCAKRAAGCSQRVLIGITPEQVGLKMLIAKQQGVARNRNCAQRRVRIEKVNGALANARDGRGAADPLRDGRRAGSSRDAGQMVDAKISRWFRSPGSRAHTGSETQRHHRAIGVIVSRADRGRIASNKCGWARPTSSCSIRGSYRVPATFYGGAMGQPMGALERVAYQAF